MISDPQEPIIAPPVAPQGQLNRVLPPWQQRAALPPAGMAPQPPPRPQFQPGYMPSQSFGYAPPQQQYWAPPQQYYAPQQQQYGGGSPPWMQQGGGGSPPWMQQMLPPWMQGGYGQAQQGYQQQRPMMNPWQQQYQSPWQQRPAAPQLPQNGGAAAVGPSAGTVTSSQPTGGPPNVNQQNRTGSSYAPVFTPSNKPTNGSPPIIAQETS